MRSLLVLALVCTVALADDPFVEGAKANVTRDMKDPGSVQFRGLYVSHSAGTPILCGEVNAKNSYGAYVGFRRFYAIAGEPAMTTIEGGPMGEVLPAMWAKTCSDRSTPVQ